MMEWYLVFLLGARDFNSIFILSRRNPLWHDFNLDIYGMTLIWIHRHHTVTELSRH